MDEIPLQVTITTPCNIPELRGRHATSSGFAAVLTVRCDPSMIEVVDHARRLIDPMMSRGLFIRLASERVARAIIRHREAYVRDTTEQTRVQQDVSDGQPGGRVDGEGDQGSGSRIGAD